MVRLLDLDEKITGSQSGYCRIYMCIRIHPKHEESSHNIDKVHSHVNITTFYMVCKHKQHIQLHSEQ